jgi:hypothetical protein
MKKMNIGLYIVISQEFWRCILAQVLRIGFLDKEAGRKRLYENNGIYYDFFTYNNNWYMRVFPRTPFALFPQGKG